MKKSVIAVFAGLVSAAAFAGMNNVLVTFSTVGPDRYADGSQVCEGEYYALVWTPDGSTFAGINADGSPVGNSKIAVKAPVATKDGNCPYITFQIDEQYAADNFPGGTWGVYLLDTRKFVTDDNGVIQKGADGNPIVESVGKTSSVVNGYGAVATLSDPNMASASASGAVNAATQSVAPAGAENLKITDIKFVGDNVQLTVTGALPCLQYQVQSGDEPGVLAAPADGTAQYGKVGEMYIYTPKKPGAQFFKVNRK